MFRVKLAWSAAVVMAVFATTVCAQPVTYYPLERVTTGGTVRGFVASVDLTDPTLQIVVTQPTGTSCEANTQRTDLWQAATGVNLAINANFFGIVSGTCADVVGLSISNSVIVSPPRIFGATYDPAIVFRPGIAEIGAISPSDLAGVTHALAGVGPSNTDTDPGTLLVDNGVNIGATARVAPATRNPRTAIGVTQDGRRLIVVTIDGRQANWSVGLTLPELGNLMIEQGAWRAINLDGGDSTSFVYQAPGSANRVINRPSASGRQFRAVANHLGFRWTPPPVRPTPRPIRGVWLRPPSNIAQLEVNLNQFAQAGITDLYLETFYHGLATNNSNVFPDRFASDYLRDAVNVAAKYNIRLHAWLETAYWQFGTSGSTNFTSNPEWRVLNIATNSNGGDGTAGQIFANLGNPGVQQRMSEYCAELANYAGLWGIQTDYHRFPLDNSTGDSFTVPWSYDSWSIATFQGLYGSNPAVTAATSSGTHWERFLSWRRVGISECARRMQDAIDQVNPGIEFSAAMFATAMSSSSQIAKCQDWPAWAVSRSVDTLVPMAYGSTVASIESDLRDTVENAAGRRVVAGLAITGASPHPTISAQLNEIRTESLDSFVFFDGTPFAEAAKRDELRFWLLNNATRQPADFDADGDVDAQDRSLFASVYQGIPVPVNATNTRYDLNASGTIDEVDRVLTNDFFARYRFGEDGVVDQRDIDALAFCLGQTPAVAGIPHLYDLDGNGTVQQADLLILHTMLTVDLPDRLDVSGDGRVTIEDLYTQHRVPSDVNYDGSVDEIDLALVQSGLRQAEQQDVIGP